MKLEDLHIVYFVGVGGIGMSAIARWFNHHGIEVHGYDRTPTSLTTQLQQEGIAIHFEDNTALIPQRLLKDKENALVVYTPAIPADHQELNHLKSQQLTIMKRSEVLGLITESIYTVAVAGTHGKTTTSSMVAHLLKESGRDITAFMGGISTNYNSNFLINEKLTEETIAVVEADEFDRSFLTLHPDIAVITSMDADHLDIYGDKNQLGKSFGDFVNKIENNGHLFIQERLVNDIEAPKRISKRTYGLNQGQFFAVNLTINNGFFEFDFCGGGHDFLRLSLGVPGYHNVENMVAAIAVVLQLGLTEEEIRKGVASYQGVKRRFEYMVRGNVTYIDDYAHHPAEIEAFLCSVRDMYPDQKITAVFQPHLYTRTRDFAEGFAKSLSLADEVFLLDIYPAREKPIEGITSRIIYKDIDAAKTMCTKEELLKQLDSRELEVIVTIGAGDIDQMVDPIKDHITQKYNA